MKCNYYEKFKILFSLGYLFISLTSCHKDSLDCTEEKFYLTFSANGQKICYSDCMAQIDSIPENSTSMFQSDIMTFISTYDMKEENDTFLINNIIVFGFPGDTIGVYNNSNIKGQDYFADFRINSGEYTFPFYETVLSENKGRFELNITEYNIDEKYIKGTFEGLLFSYNLKDSLIISNGEFKASINKKEFK